MENSLNASASGVIIKVRDLTLCRDFYSRVLSLGAPVMDSSFLVEFQRGSFRLFLEKNDWETLPGPAQGNISWYFDASDPEEVCRKIREFPGKCSVPEKMVKGHRSMFRCLDPEGNTFFIPCADHTPEE